MGSYIKPSKMNEFITLLKIMYRVTSIVVASEHKKIFTDTLCIKIILDTGQVQILDKILPYHPTYMAEVRVINNLLDKLNQEGKYDGYQIRT